MREQGDAGKPRISLYIRPGGYDDATIEAVVAKLSDRANVYVGKSFVFSESPPTLYVTLELLVNVLTGIGASAIYDGLKLFAISAMSRGVRKVPCHVRLWDHTVTTSGRQVRNLYLDIETDNQDAFVRALNTVDVALRSSGREFSYDPHSDEWNDIS